MYPPHHVETKAHWSYIKKAITWCWLIVVESSELPHQTKFTNPMSLRSTTLLVLHPGYTHLRVEQAHYNGLCSLLWMIMRNSGEPVEYFMNVLCADVMRQWQSETLVHANQIYHCHCLCLWHYGHRMQYEVEEPPAAPAPTTLGWADWTETELAISEPSQGPISVLLSLVPKPTKLQVLFVTPQNMTMTTLWLLLLSQHDNKTIRDGRGGL